MNTHEPPPLTVWARGGYELAEGSRWLGDRLIFTDILSGRLLETSAVTPTAANVIAHLDVPLGAAAPVAGHDDQWIVAAGTGIAILDRAGTLHWIDRPEDNATVPMRMNDGVCDPHGRFWAGSMAYDNTPGAGSLYRVDHDGTTTRVLDGMTVVNGPAFTTDSRRMYVADTAAGTIYRCAIDPSNGDVLDREVFVQVPSTQGSPDGMTVDTEGRLWVAMWGGSAIHCYAPDGSLTETIRVPAPQPTSVCIADTDGGTRLFVTTARYGLAHAAIESGAVLSRRIAAHATIAASFQTRLRTSLA
jgi:sugar lactone lactonase YvrE